MEFNLADLFENAADAFAEREYLVCGSERRTYAQMEARANQLAHHLAEQGVKPGDHVGIYGVNSVSWVESLWAVFKLRATWININYRYVDEELAYLFDNADLVALLHDADLTPHVEACLPHLPRLRHRLAYGPAYDAALAAQSPERDFGPRSGDDLYVLFTGGTTGMPKGVVWRHEDVFFALGGGIEAATGVRMERPEQMVEKGRALPRQMTSLPIAPLMHGASQWGVMGGSFVGNRVVLVPRFDPHEVWRLVQVEGVNSIAITGDAMGRPLVEALQEEPSSSYDLSSLFSISSTAAVFSPSVKDEFLEHFPNLVLTEAIGSSEGGANGYAVVRRGATAMDGGPRVTPISGAAVLDDDGRPVAPGGTGKVARSGHIPLGYLGDPVKTAEVFRTYDGVRFVVPGDAARLEEDGTITLLGRGSGTINTGGEKVFPEEVEAAVKSHAEVYDAVVVGAPDERWGQRVAVVVQARGGTSPTLASLQEHCRTRLAGYKIPRELHLVDAVVRSPSGKPDYRWAKSVVTRDPALA